MLCAVLSAPMTWIGCGDKAHEAPLAPATLDVANPTTDLVQVYLSSDWIGEVAPGEIRRFVALRPGAATVSLVRPGESSVVEQAVDLRSGQRHRVTAPLRVGEEPRPIPAGLGAIRVVNALPFDVELSRGHESLANLFAGAERVLPGLPAGTLTLTARAYSGDRAWSTEVTVPVDETATWVIDEARGALQLRNAGLEAVVIRLDPEDAAARNEPISLAPNESKTLPDLLVGRHTLDAVSQQSLIRDKAVVTLAPGETTEWVFAAPDSGIEVDNTSSEAVEFSLDGEVLATVPAEESRSFERIRPGERLLTGVGMLTGMRYSLPLVLGASQVFRWQIGDHVGAVAVHNVSTEPMIVTGPTLVGETVAPGMTRYFSNIPAGRARFRAVGGRSGVGVETEMLVSSSSTATWELAAPTGTLVLRSERDDAVSIFMDGRPLGTVAARGTLRIDGVLPGQRLLRVQVADRKRAAKYNAAKYSVAVKPDAVTEQVVHLPTVTLALENRTGEPLGLGSVITRASGLSPGQVLEPGQKKTVRLPPGAWLVELKGRRTGLGYRDRIEAADGEELEWTLMPRLGALHLFNRRHEAVVVESDGLSLGEVPAQADRLFDGIPIGQRSIVARGVDTGYERNADLPMRDDRPTPWEVTVETASLRVENQTEEVMDLEIDGRPYGRLEANSQRGFGRIAPDVHRISATAVRSGRRYEVQVAFGEGRLHQWKVAEETGHLVVDNRRESGVSLAVGGRESQTLAGRSQLDRSLTEGKQILTATDATALGADRQAISVKPQQTYQWTVEKMQATLRVENHTTHTLLLRANGRPVGHSYPNEIATFDAIPTGAVRITAEPEDPQWAGLQWVFRRQVSGGVDMNWTIEPTGTVEETAPTGTVNEAAPAGTVEDAAPTEAPPP